MRNFVVFLAVICFVFVPFCSASNRGRPKGSKARPKKGAGDQSLTQFFARTQQRPRLRRYVAQAAIDGKVEAVDAEIAQVENVAPVEAVQDPNAMQVDEELAPEQNNEVVEMRADTMNATEMEVDANNEKKY